MGGGCNWAPRISEICWNVLGSQEARTFPDLTRHFVLLEFVKSQLHFVGFQGAVGAKIGSGAVYVFQSWVVGGDFFLGVGEFGHDGLETLANAAA